MCDFGDWNRWNQGLNQSKLRVYWSIEGSIKQIKNQEPNCKRRSNQVLTIEFDRGEIA